VVVLVFVFGVGVGRVAYRDFSCRLVSLSH
jgi:hypothetical protein